MNEEQWVWSLQVDTEVSPGSPKTRLQICVDSSTLQIGSLNFSTKNVEEITVHRLKWTFARAWSCLPFFIAFAIAWPGKPLSDFESFACVALSLVTLGLLFKFRKDRYGIRFKSRGLADLIYLWADEPHGPGQVADEIWAQIRTVSPSSTNMVTPTSSHDVQHRDGGKYSSPFGGDPLK